MEAFMKRNQQRPHLIYIHPVYDKGERPSPRLVKQRLRAMVAFMRDKSNANTHWAFSTGLEDDVSYDTYLARYSFIRTIFSGVVVRNPNGATRPDDCDESLKVRGASSADLCELHGANSLGARSKVVLSLDGVSISSPSYKDSISVQEARNFVKNNKKAFAIFLWRCNWQGVCLDQPDVKTRRYTFTSADKRIVNRIFNG